MNKPEANHHPNGGSRRPGNGSTSFRRPANDRNRLRHPEPSAKRTGEKKPVPPVTEGMPARRIALKVIRKVTEEGAYASLALDAALRGCGLIAADRARKMEERIDQE